MTLLEIRNLNKAFGSNKVLDNINLTVEEGEFFVLLGPSGGGKSTLLKILCGIETADSGEILLNGRDINKLPSRERNIGMVFQDYGLYPHMNTWENIAYGLQARGMPKDEIKQRVEAAAQKLSITPLLQRIIVDLSGGEQQRVALARALAKDADLYLFDEPLSNLDPKLRAQARRDILMVHREKHKPTIYVTHDQNEALASGDRIGIIAKGVLQQVGTAENLLHQPANLFVAGFLGSPAMNLLWGTVNFDTARQEYTAKVGENSIPLSKTNQELLRNYKKSTLALGIPPTAFSLEAPANPQDVLNVTITDIEDLVGEVIVKFDLAGKTVAALFPSPDEEFSIGQPLKLAVYREELHLFDPDTEQVLN